MSHPIHPTSCHLCACCCAHPSGSSWQQSLADCRFDPLKLGAEPESLKW